MSYRSNPRSMTFEQREAHRVMLLGDARFVAWRGANEAYTVYLFDNARGMPCLLAYRGKSLKPALYCRYRTQARRYERASRFVEDCRAQQQGKAAARKPHTLNVGDVLRSTWGYDQTNVDYYEVVALNGQTMVTVRPIAQTREGDAFMQGTCAPVPGRYIGARSRHRVDARLNAIRISSFQVATLIEPLASAGNAPVYPASRWTAYA